MLTNQMNVQFHYVAIRKDFVIFHIRKDTGNYYKSPLVDAIRQLGRCYAVVYQQGASCYALFPNEAQKSPLSLLKEKAESIDPAVTVQSIDPEKVYKNILAQLLSNALPVLLDDYASYSNTQGKLFYRIPNDKNTKKGLYAFSMLQLQFNWNLEITMKMQPFKVLPKGQKAPNQAQYLFDPDTGELRRVLDSDKASLQRYLNRAASPKRKSTLKFLCFESLEAYQACKIGILHRYLKDVAEVLSPYMTLSSLPICESEHYTPDSRQLPNTLAETRKRLANVPFYLEDLVQDADSRSLLSLLQQELEYHSHVLALTDAPVPGSVILRIIHHRDWYASQNLPDPHEAVRPGYVVQHVTLEDFKITGHSKKEAEDAALRKILLEIAIKLDIQAGLISTYPWRKLNLPAPIHFVLAQDEKGTNWFHCFRLTIQPDGRMQFDDWRSDSPNLDIPHMELTLAFSDGNGGRSRQTDGLVYLENAPICKIQQTERYTLPNMDQLENALRSTVDGTLLDVLPVKKLAEELCAAEPQKQHPAYQKILNSLNTLGDKATRKEIRRAINLRSAAGQNINRSYWKQSGICIGNNIRQKKNFETYLGATLGIRWYQEKESVFFFSGYKSESLPTAFQHACRIRKLSACDGSDCTCLMPILLPMLAVDFVAASGWTVLPFPFKYLREYAAQSMAKQIVPCPE